MGPNNFIGTDAVEIVYDSKADELVIRSKNLGRVLANSKQRIMGANIVVFISSDEASNSMNNSNGKNGFNPPPSHASLGLSLSASSLWLHYLSSILI